MKYTPVIGLEVHVELKTKSKMFCGCSSDYFGQKPNTHTCPVCLGLPGALPYPNKKAIEWCIMIGLALNCDIPLLSKFDRKNYFYPDLPKGYQISQYDKPFCINGSIKLSSKKTIGIRRVHMEEDTGKLIHKTIDGEKISLIDFNRSGVPLVEIVTEPDFESAEEVKEYLQKLQQTVRYLEVSNADMEKGDMRLEPNISLREEGKIGLPNYRVEVKNINSFRFVGNAIKAEIDRQTENPTQRRQETRRYDESTNTTVLMRRKEEAADYRYFPEPDIPPFHWEKLQISNFKTQMPELPEAKYDRFEKTYKLPRNSAEILTREKALADFFEKAVKDGAKLRINPNRIANYVINKKPDYEKILPADLIKSIITSSKISDVSEEQLKKFLDKVLMENPRAVSDYKLGHENAIMFLVGQVLRQFTEKVDAQKIKASLLAKLK